MNNGGGRGHRKHVVSGDKWPIRGFFGMSTCGPGTLNLRPSFAKCWLAGNEEPRPLTLPASLFNLQCALRDIVRTGSGQSRPASPTRGPSASPAQPQVYGAGKHVNIITVSI